MKVLSKKGTKIIFLIFSLIILLTSILLLTRCHTLRISKNILNVEERELLDGNSNQLEDGIEFNVKKQWNFRNTEEADNYRATFKLKKTVGQVTTDVLDLGNNIKTITIIGNESGKFEDLPKYELEQEITYSVEEIKIEKTTDGGTTWVEVPLKMYDTEYLTNAVFKKYDGQTNLFGISMTKTDIKSFSRNTTLTKDEVLAKPGVTRIDNIDDDGFKSDFEIYGYIENDNFYWWSEAEEVYFHPDTTNAFRDYYNCVTIDLTGTNTSLVTDFSYWFQQDSYTKTQFTTLIGAMDTSSATNMAGMFYDCNKLLAIDTSKFNTSKVTSMYKMFGTLRSIDTLDVSMFDTSNVTNMEWMFRCMNAKELDLSSFDTSKVTNMRQMFYQLSTAPNAINATYRLETIKLGPKFTTSKVTNMEGMFGECKKLKTIYVVDDLDTSKATKHTNMFINCTNLVGEAGTIYETPFDENYLDKTYARIAKEGEPGYFTQYVPEAEEDEIDSEKIDIKYELVKNIEKETAGYTVYYKEQGTNNTIAESKTVNGLLIGERITENAISIEGYKAVTPDSTEIEIVSSGNEYTFYYTKRNDLEYIVHYKEEGTEKTIGEDKLVSNQTFGDTAHETAIDIDGYNKVNPVEADINITAGTNEYTFYYTKRADLGYTVHYKEQGTEKVLADDKIETNQTFGDKVHEEAIDIERYSKVEPAEADINITTGTNEYTFYYTKRNDLSYTVYYKEQGTEKEIAQAKKVNNQLLEDTVSEEAIEIDGYNKVEPTEAEIEITEGTNEHTFYYTKRNDLEYKVRYVDQTINEEIEESKVVKDVTFETEVKVEDEIKTINKYNYVEYDKEKIIVGTNPDENVITLYYTKKNASVIVHHYEEGTTNRVAEDVLIPGKVDDEYHAQVATDIPEYLELATEPQNKDGVMTVEQIEVIYYYKVKDTKVIVNYIDKNTNETIAEEVVIDGKVKDSYETEKKDIENYTFVEDTQNTNGEMTVDIIHVNYYYKHNAKVIVNYIYKDVEENEETLKTKEETGLEGDTITTAPENFEGYVIGEKPENETVTMTVEPITVNYYYKKISKGVVEKHIDENNNSILYEEVHTGVVGEEYEITSREFNRYELDEENLPTNSKSTLKDDVIEVVYKYKYIAKVTAKYVDQDGEKIVDPVIIEGNIGDNYKTEQKEFKKYDYVKTTGEPEGEMTREDIEVTYHYKIILKKVIENHIDVQENEVITNDEHQVSPGDEYSTKPKDLENYDVIIEKLPSNGSGEMENEDIVINYYYIRKAKVEVEFVDLYTGKKVTKEVEHNGHVGDEYSVEELEIPGYKLVAEKYPLNASGEMTKDPIKVTYYYVKESTVTEKHMYKNTVLAEETHTGLEGDHYSIKPREFENYILDEENLPENREGSFTDQDVVVTFRYVEKGIVIEKHIDEDTKTILAYEKHEGKVGDKYKISSRTFSGYEIEYTSTENNMGVMTKEPIEVIFWYKKAEKKTTPAQEQPKGQGNPAPATVVIRDNGTTYVPSSNGGTTSKASSSDSSSVIKNISTNTGSNVTPKVDPDYDVVSNVPDTDSETNKVFYAVAAVLVLVGIAIIVVVAVINKKKGKEDK